MLIAAATTHTVTARLPCWSEWLAAVAATATAAVGVLLLISLAGQVLLVSALGREPQGEEQQQQSDLQMCLPADLLLYRT
jgi:hypothetical protein